MLSGKAQVRVSADYPVMPMDKYTVQITDVSEKTKTFNGEETPGLNYELTILNSDKTMEIEGEPHSLRGRKLWYWVSNNLSNRSNLGKLWFILNGRELTKEEISDARDNGFDANSLVNQQLTVMVEVADGTGASAGKQFNNIIGIAKPEKQLTPIADREIPVQVVDSKEDPAASDPDKFIAGLEADQNKEEGKA